MCRRQARDSLLRPLSRPEGRRVPDWRFPPDRAVFQYQCRKRRALPIPRAGGGRGFLELAEDMLRGIRHGREEILSIATQTTAAVSFGMDGAVPVFSAIGASGRFLSRRTRGGSQPARRNRPATRMISFMLLIPAEPAFRIDTRYWVFFLHQHPTML